MCAYGQDIYLSLLFCCTLGQHPEVTGCREPIERQHDPKPRELSHFCHPFPTLQRLG